MTRDLAILNAIRITDHTGKATVVVSTSHEGKVDYGSWMRSEYDSTVRSQIERNGFQQIVELEISAPTLKAAVT